MNAPAELALGYSVSTREAGLWMFAAAAVVLAHAAVSFAFQSQTLSPPHSEAEEAMVVELAQLPFVSSAAVMSETLSEETPVEEAAPEEVLADPVEKGVSEAVTEDLPEPVVPEETPVIEQTEPEIVREETAEPVEEEIPEQEVAEAIDPEVVVPLPRPDKIVEEEPAERVKGKPQKKVERKKAERRKAVRKAEVRREAKSRADASVESRAAKAPTVSPARWNSQVRAAIARRAGRAGGLTGTVHVRFVVSASGAITSASVTGSSGNSRLDSAALRMVRSARVPPPPAGLPGSSHSFMIPLSFR
ncbi:MAG: TonB family protein [Mesorhizobium sp.]|nr:TonB family protein [Mesorhizobium sp.]MCO5160146.1 TonB family protein [Mesorhizobium sp.]